MVETEVAATRSRADIVIRGPEMNVVIEMKIDALEGERQCERLYVDHIADGTRFIFLTPRGRAPTSCDADLLSEWACLSFPEVRRILSDLIETMEDGTPSKDTARTYLATLQREFP